MLCEQPSSGRASKRTTRAAHELASWSSFLSEELDLGLVTCPTRGSESSSPTVAATPVQSHRVLWSQGGIKLCC